MIYLKFKDEIQDESFNQIKNDTFEDSFND